MDWIHDMPRDMAAQLWHHAHPWRCCMSRMQESKRDEAGTAVLTITKVDRKHGVITVE